MDTIAGRFEIDWAKEDLEAVRRTILKKYNAEIHSQSAIEGLLELKAESGFRPDEIERIELDTFDVAYQIIGGGEEGDKHTVRTKEEADHSLPYLLAVAVLDGSVMPEQYAPERIRREDVQELLRRVVVRPREEFSRRFPAEMVCQIRVTLHGGRVLTKEKADYEGFLTRPARWDGVVSKFERLTEPYASRFRRAAIIDAIANLDSIRIPELMRLLEGEVQHE